MVQPWVAGCSGRLVSRRGAGHPILSACEPDGLRLALWHCAYLKRSDRYSPYHLYSLTDNANVWCRGQGLGDARMSPCDYIAGAIISRFQHRGMSRICDVELMIGSITSTPHERWRESLRYGLAAPDADRVLPTYTERQMLYATHLKTE